MVGAGHTLFCWRDLAGSAPSAGPLESSAIEPSPGCALPPSGGQGFCLEADSLRRAPRPLAADPEWFPVLDPQGSEFKDTISTSVSPVTLGEHQAALCGLWGCEVVGLSCENLVHSTVVCGQLPRGRTPLRALAGLLGGWSHFGLQQAAGAVFSGPQKNPFFGLVGSG